MDSQEEVQYWNKAAESVQRFVELRKESSIKMAAVNRIVMEFPEGLDEYDSMKKHKNDYTEALKALKEHDERELGVSSATHIVSHLVQNS